MSVTLARIKVLANNGSATVAVVQQKVRIAITMYRERRQEGWREKEAEEIKAGM